MKCQAVTRDGEGHITVKRSDGKVKTLSPLPVVYHPSGQVIFPLATTAISWKKEAEISGQAFHSTSKVQETVPQEKLSKLQSILGKHQMLGTFLTARLGGRRGRDLEP